MENKRKINGNEKKVCVRETKRERDREREANLFSLENLFNFVSIVARSFWFR